VKSIYEKHSSLQVNKLSDGDKVIRAFIVTYAVFALLVPVLNRQPVEVQAKESKKAVTSSKIEVKKETQISEPAPFMAKEIGNIEPTKTEAIDVPQEKVIESAPVRPQVEPDSIAQPVDRRLEQIQITLTAMGSPDADKAQFMHDTALKYGLDPIMMVSIFGQESSLGKACWNNNCYGWHLNDSGTTWHKGT